jgi:hypothetical protein
MAAPVPEIMDTASYMASDDGTLNECGTVGGTENW